jgi:hypothetical protein
VMPHATKNVHITETVAAAEQKISALQRSALALTRP